VAPVLEPAVTHRTTYLPHGLWWDYWSNEHVDGGRDVTREVSLDTLPLYVKAGSILPIGPVKQYTGEQSNEPMKLRVYPGADGAFSLYEDDGSSFNYQQKQFTCIRCFWDDKNRTLTLQADPLGQLPSHRILVAEIVGIDESKRITLSGNAASVVNWPQLP
jgi:alpha-glucosidase/alpha-D-xyloside xylohydrolase